jgi:hypothetical protein
MIYIAGVAAIADFVGAILRLDRHNAQEAHLLPAIRADQMRGRKETWRTVHTHGTPHPKNCSANIADGRRLKAVSSLSRFDSKTRFGSQAILPPPLPKVCAIVLEHHPPFVAMAATVIKYA